MTRSRQCISALWLSSWPGVGRRMPGSHLCGQTGLYISQRPNRPLYQPHSRTLIQGLGLPEHPEIGGFHRGSGPEITGLKGPDSAALRPNRLLYQPKKVAKSASTGPDLKVGTLGTCTNLRWSFYTVFARRTTLVLHHFWVTGPKMWCKTQCISGQKGHF